MLKKGILIFITLLILSCNGNKSSLSKDDAEYLMEEYFEKTKLNDFNIISSYYSDLFYESTEKEKWEELYNKIHTILGLLIETTLESWKVESIVNTSGSGKYFTFVYNNNYENGQVIETIILFLPKGEDEIKILKHNYNSNVFIGMNV